MQLILLLVAMAATAQTVDLIRPRTPAAIEGAIGFVRYGGKPPTMHVLREFFANRVQPPAAPGPCYPDGQGAWATDRQYFYVCVPSANGGDFVWARIPLQTEW